jgi:transposase
VLEALDALLAVLRESARRNLDATRRAQTIQRLRQRGGSYREILGRVERELIHQVTRENLDALLQASSRLRRAEAKALYGEGMTMEQIAALFGVTRQRVSVLLRDGERGGTSP